MGRCYCDPIGQTRQLRQGRTAPSQSQMSKWVPETARCEPGPFDGKRGAGMSSPHPLEFLLVPAEQVWPGYPGTTGQRRGTCKGGVVKWACDVARDRWGLRRCEHASASSHIDSHGPDFPPEVRVCPLSGGQTSAAKCGSHVNSLYFRGVRLRTEGL